MNVDFGKSGETIRINMDITLPYVPCHVVSLDIMDIMGKHEVHRGGNLLQNRLDSNGNVLQSNIHIDEH